MTTFWINGSACSPEDAKVSVLDHGFLYGDGVFEGIRCVAGRVLDLELHLDRFELSARAVYLAPPARAEARRAVLSCLSQLQQPDAYVRLILTRGEGALGIDVSSCKQPQLICIAGTIQLYAERPGGISLATVSLRRPAADVLDPRVKSLNYLNNVMAKLEAKRCGADEALVLNARGTVAEASGANVFAVLDGTLCTPPLSDGALGGITRRRVLSVASAAGITCAERSLTRYDLLAAQEVFLTGTGAGLVPVGSLDAVAIATRTALVPRLRELCHSYAVEHGTAVPTQKS